MLPRPTTTCFVQHWLFQPNVLPQPSSSYTGCVIILVCRGFSQEFGVVRLYRTFSMYLVTGETRSAGCFCTSSGWFKHSEPHRTYSNHNSTEIVRCGDVCHMSSGWFDCTERCLSTSLQGKQGVQGVSALVRGGSSTANRIEPTRTTSSQKTIQHGCLRNRKFGHLGCASA